MSITWNILHYPMSPRKAHVSLLLLGGDIVAILLVTSTGTWWHLEI